MPAQLERADMIRVAHSIGKKGDPLPAEMADDPDYKAAHARGAGYTARAAGFHPPTRPRQRPATSEPSAPTPAPARVPASTRPSRPPRTAFGAARKTFSAVAGSRATGQAVASAGDAGGLLLVLVLYPMVLSMVKYGTAGPGLWFRAKWLNQSFDKQAVADAKNSGAVQPKRQLTLPEKLKPYDPNNPPSTNVPPSNRNPV